MLNINKKVLLNNKSVTIKDVITIVKCGDIIKGVKFRNYNELLTLIIHYNKNNNFKWSCPRENIFVLYKNL